MNDDGIENIERLEIKLSNGRRLKVIDVEVRYIDENGKPLSAKEFLEQLIKILPGFFDSEEALRTLWANPDSREKLLYWSRDKIVSLKYTKRGATL
ncbi:MAG: hypothetical protein WKG06_13455 [Segetibacter sp.]